MPQIIISYRREDSGVITGRIFDRLVARYGRDAIFRDIDNIAAAPPAPAEEESNAALSTLQPRPADTTRPNPKIGFFLQLIGEYTEQEARAMKQAFETKYAQTLTVQKVAIRRVDSANSKAVFGLEIGPFATQKDVLGYCRRILFPEAKCTVRRAAP